MDDIKFSPAKSEKIPRKVEGRWKHVPSNRKKIKGKCPPKCPSI